MRLTIYSTDFGDTELTAEFVAECEERWPGQEEYTTTDMETGEQVVRLRPVWDARIMEAMTRFSLRSDRVSPLSLADIGL